MPRDIYSSQHRSRSRSFSAYRYNNDSRHIRQPSPPPPPRYRNRSDSPPPATRFRYSRSRSPYQHNGGRNGHKSRTPEAPIRRRRERSSSKAPEPSTVLGVFGLHVRTSEGEIRDIFERYGPVEKVHMVYDAKSQGFRGYCFIYYAKMRDATNALNETNGMEVKDRRIRVDYSKTKRAHTPTPGFYRGNRGRPRSSERQRPPRRDFANSDHDRFRRREEPPRRMRSRERVETYERAPPLRDMDRGMRHRSDGRRRSVEREVNHRIRARSPPKRDSFRRRDRS